MRDNERDKKDLEEKIVEAQKNLNELKKRNQVNTISSQSGGQEKEEGEVNVDELLNALTKSIHSIYKNQFEIHGDLEAK